MIITPGTLGMLRTTIETKFKDAFASQSPWSKDVVTEVPSSNDSNTYAWVADFGQIREWIGPRQMQVMREHVQVVRNKPYEGSFSIERDRLLDDSFGFYVDVITPGLAAAAAKHADHLLVADVLVANPNTYDGVALYAVNHPTFAPDGGVYSNSFVMDISDKSVTDGIATQVFEGDTNLVLAQSLAWIRAKMAAIPGESGRLLDVNLNQILASRQREFDLKQILNASLTPSGTSGAVYDVNPVKGLFTSEVYAGELTNRNVIYLSDTSKVVRPFIHQIRSRPIVRALTQPDSEMAVMQNRFVYAVDGDDGGSYRCAMTTSLPFLTARLTIQA